MTDDTPARQRAVALLRRAHQAASRDHVRAEELLPLAMGLLATGELEAAVEVFRLGQAAAPELPEFDLGVVTALLAQDRLDAAEAEVRAHLERHPGSAAGYLQLAGCHRRRGDHEALLDALLRAIQLDPEDPQALDLFVEIHLDRGEEDLLEPLLLRFADELGAAGPRLALARRAHQAGDPTRAEGLLEAALPRIDVDNPTQLAALTDLLLELGRVDEAVDLLEAHRQGDEELPVPLGLLLAQAYVAVGELGLARGLLPGLRAAVQGRDRVVLDQLAQRLG